MPTKFRNVHYYRIAGRYIFAGDLFIVRGSIYFFPEVDLSHQRSQAAKSVPHDLALATSAVVYLAQKVSFYTSGVDNLLGKGMSDEWLREKADAHIRELKGGGRKNFTDSLPLPTRIMASEISDMRLSRTGRLSFSAQSDNHDFNVGLRRRKRLRDALWEVGLGRV